MSGATSDPYYANVGTTNAVPTFEEMTRADLMTLNTRIAQLSTELDQVRAMTRQAAGDARTQRLREVAIDTAIRNSGHSVGGQPSPTTIVAAAKVYFTFLDTGELLGEKIAGAAQQQRPDDMDLRRKRERAWEGQGG